MNNEEYKEEPEGTEEAGQQSTIDEAMLEIGDFVGQMSEIDGYLFSGEEQFNLYAERISLDMPVQLDIKVTDTGIVKIGSSPPLYYVETSIMPVFHQIRINMESNNLK